MKKPSPNPQGPPRWADHLLSWLTPSELLEELQGDLQEQFDQRARQVGPWRARWWYGMEALKVIRPYYLQRRVASLVHRLKDFCAKQPATTRPQFTPKHPSPPLMNPDMLLNYFKIAWRTLVQNKVYSFINLVGLTFGLVTSMLIFQYVIFENSADRFHTNSNQIYRVALKQTDNNGTPEVFSQVFLGAGEAFKKEVPAVESFTRIRADFFQEGPTITRSNNTEKIAIKDIRSILTDPSFLTVFTFPMIRGDAATALQNPSSILLTARMAQRLFGDTDPMGKMIDYSLANGPQSLIVTGVLQDPPANSHIQFDVVLPLQKLIGSMPESDRQAWNFRGVYDVCEIAIRCRRGEGGNSTEQGRGSFDRRTL